MASWHEDDGYEPDDPKSAGFYERMVARFDARDKTVEPVTCAYQDVDESAGAKGNEA